MLTRTRTCFLIDDDIDDQEVFQMALQRVDEKIQLNCANNGAEGLQQLKDDTSFIPDFIFLDINMPKMNGIQCLSELKKLPHLSNARIIMYSTSSEDAIKKQCREMGADEFMVKPSKIKLLVDELAILLAKN